MIRTALLELWKPFLLQLCFGQGHVIRRSVTDVIPQCRSRRTIDFAYDPDEDTAERVADEITSLFELSSTDRDICAAALKEWLAKELPDNDSS